MRWHRRTRPGGECRGTGWGIITTEMLVMELSPCPELRRAQARIPVTDSSPAHRDDPCLSDC